MVRHIRFFWNAWWRDRGKTAKAVNVTVVSIPAALTAISGITRSDLGFPWWQWGLLALGAIIVTVLVGAIRRAVDLEESLEPKIELSCRVREQEQLPKGSPLTKWVQIVVSSIGNADLIDCEVQVVDLYRNGQRLYDEPLNCIWSNSQDARRTIRSGIPQSASVCMAYADKSGLYLTTTVNKPQIMRAMRNPEPATYRVDVAVHATNSKPKREWFVIEYGGDFARINIRRETLN
jgi:hypothetical protein